MTATHDVAVRWATTWRVAWEALDPEPIVALYAPDATLSTEPFREPYRGRNGVREYVTRVFGEEADPRAWMSVPIVDGRRAAVAWWATLLEDGRETTLAGVSVLRFASDGLVLEQWDAWNRAPERRRPPTDGSPFTARDT